MGVRVVEAWKYALKSKVNLARVRVRQRQHLGVRAHGYKSRAANGHGLSSRLGFIQRPDVSVIQNGFWLFCTQERQHQQAAHTLHEIPTRKRSHRDTSRKPGHDLRHTCDACWVQRRVKTKTPWTHRVMGLPSNSPKAPSTACGNGIDGHAMTLVGLAAGKVPGEDFLLIPAD